MKRLLSRFSGVMPPLLVPLNSDRTLNENVLRRYVDWLIDQGVTGLFPNGTMGEFIRIPKSMRVEVSRIVIDQASGRVPVIVGASEENPSEILKIMDIYQKQGASAVSILPPYYFSVSTQTCRNHFTEIASRTSLDFFVYNFPKFAPVISMDMMEELLSISPHFIGIKDTSGDFSYMTNLIQKIRPLRKGFSLFTGWDPIFLPMLRLGVDGGILSMSGVIPRLMRKIYDGSFDLKSNQSEKIQNRIHSLFQILCQTEEFPQGFRSALSILGFNFQQSATASSIIDKVQLNKIQKEINLLKITGK